MVETEIKKSNVYVLLKEIVHPKIIFVIVYNPFNYSLSVTIRDLQTSGELMP